MEIIFNCNSYAGKNSPSNENVINYLLLILGLFADWNEEAVSSAEILRMIYQGRFLHGNVTLAALGLPTGKTTVMHLVPRESLPEPNSQGQSELFIKLSYFDVILYEGDNV